MPSIGQELLNVPMGDMIRQMAFAIAEAQVKLDEASIDVAEMMGGLRVVYDDEGNLNFDDSRVFFGHEYMTVKEAEAHLALDAAISGGESQMTLDALKEAQKLTNPGTDGDIRVPMRLSMLELGFSPTFYQFVDTIIEVKIAIKITRSSEYTRRTTDTDRRSASSQTKPGFFSAVFGKKRTNSNSNVVTTSQVDASYSSKYSYSAEGASLLRTKLAPLPPPPILEDRIRRTMEMEEARRQARLKTTAEP